LAVTVGDSTNSLNKTIGLNATQINPTCAPYSAILSEFRALAQSETT
jgi:hypothetical protein